MSLLNEGTTFDKSAFANLIIYKGLVPKEDAVAVFGQRMAEHPSFSIGLGYMSFNYCTSLAVISYQKMLKSSVG